MNGVVKAQTFPKFPYLRFLPHWKDGQATESKDSSVYSLRSAYGVLGAAELGAERKNGGIFRSLIWVAELMQS